jgi:hypothetical protein
MMASQHITGLGIDAVATNRCSSVNIEWSVRETGNFVDLIDGDDEATTASSKPSSTIKEFHSNIVKYLQF